MPRHTMSRALVPESHHAQPCLAMLLLRQKLSGSLHEHLLSIHQAPLTASAQSGHAWKGEQPKPFAYTHWKRLDILGFKAEASAHEFTEILAVQSRSKTEQCELGDGVVNQGTIKRGKCDRGNDGCMANSGVKRTCHLAFLTLGINLSTLQWLLYLTKQLLRSVN